MLAIRSSSSHATYLNQNTQVRPNLRYLLFIGLLRNLSSNGLSSSILREKALENSSCWVACVREGGADGYENGGCGVLGLADGGDGTQDTECET